MKRIKAKMFSVGIALFCAFCITACDFCTLQKNESEQSYGLNESEQSSLAEGCSLTNCRLHRCLEAGLDPSELDEETQQKFQALVKYGESMVGSYRFQEKVLLGEVCADIDRMSLEEVKDIIDSEVEFEKILQVLVKRQEYPDYMGGSGVTIIEYWLDDSGEHIINIILEQGQISYTHITDNGKTPERLYPVK